MTNDRKRRKEIVKIYRKRGVNRKDFLAMVLEKLFE